MDCPPSTGLLPLNALNAADEVIIPVQCEYYAMEGLSVITHLIERLRSGGVNPGLGLQGILMTMFDGRTNLAGDVVREVRSHFNDAVYETVIPRNVRISEAPSFGQPVVTFDPASRGAQAYRALAREFDARERARAAAHA